MNETAIEKIVVVTRQTALEELIERFNTREQARFYIEHMGASFDEYEASHNTYLRALETLKTSLPSGVRHQWIERAFLPNFSFGPTDCVVTLGPDGLVVNSAKYLTTQPLVAFNPDARRIDGILVPFRVEDAQRVLERVVRGAFLTTEVSMAQAQLNDGQTLHAVNDLFIGQRTHTSARYALRLQSDATSETNHRAALLFRLARVRPVGCARF
jgi:NAD kinase